MEYNFQDDRKGGFKIFADGEEIKTIPQDEVGTKVNADRGYVEITNGINYALAVYINEVNSASNVSDVLAAIDTARSNEEGAAIDPNDFMRKDQNLHDVNDVNESRSTLGLTYHPKWTKFTKTFSNFNLAGTGPSNSDVYTPVANEVVHAVFMKHSAAFTGGSISAYTISISNGVTTMVPAFNVFQAPSNSAQTKGNSFAPTRDNFGNLLENITASAISTGGNLNTATAGSVDIWILTSILP